MLPGEALHQQGMSGRNREQVLQSLIKLELDSLLSQVCALLCALLLIPTGKHVKAACNVHQYSMCACVWSVSLCGVVLQSVRWRHHCMCASYNVAKSVLASDQLLRMVAQQHS